ncbi:MAG: J domain-containing protein [Prochlorothrix sp.]|nr:J domain-containing protein [Prochlorothrix sp.]
MNSQDLKAHWERLGLEPGASPEAIKAAYQAQVRAFPPATHPQDFKAIRKAYDILKDPKNHVVQQEEVDFWQPTPTSIRPDPETIAKIRTQLQPSSSLDLKTLIRLSF